MRFIDRTGCVRMSDRGVSTDVRSMGALSRSAAAIAEKRRLGVLRTHWGVYRVIRECGLGAYSDSFSDLASVDAFLKRLDGARA